MTTGTLHEMQTGCQGKRDRLQGRHNMAHELIGGLAHVCVSAADEAAFDKAAPDDELLPKSSLQPPNNRQRHKNSGIKRFSFILYPPLRFVLFSIFRFSSAAS